MFFFEVKVVRDGRRQSWSFGQSVYGASSNVCDIIEVDGMWHVMAGGYFLKCRPYEADLRFPASYGLLTLADIRGFTEENPLGTMEFEKRNGSQLSFRLRPTGEHRRILEKMAESRRLNANDLTFEQRRREEQTVARAREQLADGCLR